MPTTYDLPAAPFHLSAGGHSGPEDGACFNELASMLAGQPFSAAPACVSTVIQRMGMTLNDRLDDERRQLLRPFVLRSLGTASDGRDAERRQLCTEWLLHHALPDLLEQAGRNEAADKLRALPGDLAVEGVRRAIREARDEAQSARREAVGKLSERIREAMRERWPDAAAAAAAAAAADAPDAAVAVAAVAAAAAVAVAAVVVADAANVVADAADVAVAVAAVVVAVADAPDAVANVVAVVAGVALAARRNVYGAVYDAVYAKMRERFQSKPLAPGLLESALELMDRMLPDAPIRPAAIEHASAICAAP